MERTTFYACDLDQDLLTIAVISGFRACHICFVNTALTLQYYLLYSSLLIPSVLRRCWLGGRKGIRPAKNFATTIQPKLK